MTQTKILFLNMRMNLQIATNITLINGCIPEMFKYLLGYSPVHNVKQNMDYPATMITTGDHDDRVVPAHSFKFAANLQDKHVGEDPVLIRIEKEAGHGSGTPLAKVIDQYADIYGFTLFNMGVKKIK